jgi:hypothetical protein
MNRKVVLLIGTSLLLVLLLVTVAAAQTSNPREVTYDTFWDINADATAVNGAASIVDAQGSESACTLTRAGLLQWDVSDISTSATIGQVKVTLHTIRSSTGTVDSTKLALFGAPDNWDDTTTQGALPTPPASSTTPLATINGPFTNGVDIVFQVTGSSDPLIQYFQSQATGDNIASIWVEFTEGCPGGGTALVAWDSKEAGNPATLDLSDTNAVTLSTFSANDGQPNWPLIAGLLALVAVVVAGTTYVLRRSKQS